MFVRLHWDTETHAIAPGRPAPRPVCLQWLGERADGSIDGPHLLTGDDMLEWFAWALRSGIVMSGLNCAYDLLVMIEHAIARGIPALTIWSIIFEWMAAAMMRCTETRERLIRIALGQPDQGNLSLEAQSKTYLGLEVTGKHGADAWRLRYGELERWPTIEMLDLADAADLGDGAGIVAVMGTADWRRAVAKTVREIVTPQQVAELRAGHWQPGGPRPPSTWPRAAWDYAVGDVVLERGVYRGQEELAIEVFGQPEIPDEVARPIAKFCLHLMASRGLRVDTARARLAASSLEHTLASLRGVLVQHGLMREKIVHRGKPNERHDGHAKIMAALHGRIERALTSAGVPVQRNAPTSRKLASGEIKVTPGKVKADKEVLQLPELHDDVALRTYIAFNGAEKMLGTYVRPLCVDCGDPHDGWCGLTRPVHWRYDAVKDTGRTSAKRTSYTARRLGPGGDVEIVTERDGNNVQNYPTESAMVAKARDILGVLGPGMPGDRQYDDQTAAGEAAIELAISAGARAEDARAALWSGELWEGCPQTFVLAWPKVQAELEREHQIERAMPSALFMERRVRQWARRHDVRTMVIARDGYKLINRDYSGIEMAALAECQYIHFGREVTLQRVLNEGLDPHCYVGVLVHEILWNEARSYDELIELNKEYKKALAAGLTPSEEADRAFRTRKLCKVVNFGFLGGMGAKTFVQYVWQRERLRISEEQARELKRAWYEAFPEMPEWFSYIGQQVDAGVPVTQIGSGRVRGGCSFTQNANTRFQGLAADGALNALFRIWHACLTQPTSPLYGSFPLVFEHDAFLVEVPADRALEADAELERLMILGMRELIPDVVVKTEGAPPSHRWEK